MGSGGSSHSSSSGEPEPPPDPAPDPEPAPEPEPAPAPEPTPEPDPVVITPEDEGDDTVVFSGGTTSSGISSAGSVSGDTIFGGSGEDTVIFDDPLA